ncbi:MAG TPA: hypothetical protein PLS45_03420 [Bacillota bacterium]|nr:hypothetical protein [Bacillota bacterium]
MQRPGSWGFGETKGPALFSITITEDRIDELEDDKFSVEIITDCASYRIPVPFIKTQTE